MAENPATQDPICPLNDTWTTAACSPRSGHAKLIVEIGEAGHVKADAKVDLAGQVFCIGACIEQAGYHALWT